jgi:hypothetical protein
MGQSQTLTLSSFRPNPTQGMPGDSIQSTRNQRMWKRGPRSTIGPQSTRSSSHGKAPQQSFEPDLSQKSRNVLTSLKTGLQTPSLLSERSSSLQDVQIPLLTSGSTLSRDMWSTLPKSLECTISLMLRLSSPIDIGDLFQLFIRVPKQSKAITSHGDWIIAFGKTIQAISYALPG